MNAAETITIDGFKVPVSGIRRSELSEWIGNIPEEFDVDRIYRHDNEIHGERWLSDGTVIEIQEDGDGWAAHHITNPSKVDPADDVLWERKKRGERELSMLVSMGLSPAEALDFWMVEIRGKTQSSWAETRGVNQQSVSENISKAREKLV